MQVLQWFVTTRIVALAIGFLLLTDFNAIPISAAILLLCIAFKTVCRNIAIARSRTASGIQNAVAQAGNVRRITGTIVPKFVGATIPRPRDPTLQCVYGWLVIRDHSVLWIAA